MIRWQMFVAEAVEIFLGIDRDTDRLIVSAGENLEKLHALKIMHLTFALILVASVWIARNEAQGHDHPSLPPLRLYRDSIYLTLPPLAG